MLKSAINLESVKSSFKHWRMTRPKQGKIPDELWQQVSELVEHYSLSKICQSLSITQKQIKDNISPSKQSSMQFVEVTNSTKVERTQLSFTAAQ